MALCDTKKTNYSYFMTLFNSFSLSLLLSVFASYFVCLKISFLHLNLFAFWLYSHDVMFKCFILSSILSTLSSNFPEIKSCLVFGSNFV